MLHCIWRSSFPSAQRHILRLVVHSTHRPTSVFCCLTKSFTIMSNRKRKATSVAAAKEPSAKQQKLTPMKEEKKERAGGGLQEKVKQQKLTPMKEEKKERAGGGLQDQVKQQKLAPKKKEEKKERAGGGLQGQVKQQKLTPMKEEKKERAGGWLQDQVKQQKLTPMKEEKKERAGGGLQGQVKQQKLTPMKKEKKERAGGWLQDQVKQQRTEKKEMKFNKKRLRFISKTEKIKQGSEGVLYWMSRDQRVQDNWALVHAQRLAVKENLPLHVCFCLVVPESELSTLRHYSFMLKGLEEVAKECKTLDIQFHLLHGSAGEVLPGFVSDRGLGAVVTDFSPLREPLQWLEDVKKRLPKDIPLIQVDAHNIVPCWVASPKLEYAARTIRGKITKLLPDFLTDLPLIEKHPCTATRTAKPVDWDKTLASLQVDRAVGEPEWAKPGTKAGMAMLESFIDVRLKLFDAQRNNPNAAALSQLSPWIRFGHLSAQRVALQVQHSGRKAGQSVTSFIEELVVRRELTDNFCFYNEKYDSVEGAKDWAQKTLTDHAKDKRPYVYTREQLEKAKTHDKLWNGAQYQMVTEGKMHGFLRMYWAKKILEWTSSPEEALSIALYLNDRYELDGQDPNGFVGCMWSICGIHDQGWAERPVFGKIRYMNYKGCLRKFNVAQFERKYNPKNL